MKQMSEGVAKEKTPTKSKVKERWEENNDRGKREQNETERSLSKFP